MKSDALASTMQERILAAIGATRGGALNFPAYFVGLQWEVADAEGCCVAWTHPQAQNLDSDGRLASMPLALLVDMTGAAAVRQRIGKEVALPTVSLQLDLVDHPLPARTSIGCQARYAMEAGGIAVAQFTLLSGEGDIIGTGHCRYLVHRSISRSVHVNYPWEDSPCNPVGLEDLNESEQQVHGMLTARFYGVERPKDVAGLHHQLFAISTRATTAASDRGLEVRGTATQLVGPHLANRRGFVQGGVVAGLGIDACVAATSPDSAIEDVRLRSFACTYLRPGRIDAGSLEAWSEISFQGRRVIHVDFHVGPLDGLQLARGSAIFEKLAKIKS